MKIFEENLNIWKFFRVMLYCHKCGTKAKLDDSFCEKCGTKIGEFVEETGKQVERIIIRQKGNVGKVFLIIFLFIACYIALDYWAAMQLQPVLSFDSIITSISNIEDLGTSYTSGYATLILI